MFSSAARTPAHERPTSTTTRRPLFGPGPRPGAAEASRARLAAGSPAFADMMVRTLASTGCIREARELTRRALAQWGLGERADDAAITVSELAANAFSHGAPPVLLVLRREQWSGPPAATATVCDQGVWDQGAHSSSEELAEGGRGLAIVRALVDSVVVNTHGPRPGSMVTARFVATAAMVQASHG